MLGDALGLRRASRPRGLIAAALFAGLAIPPEAHAQYTTMTATGAAASTAVELDRAVARVDRTVFTLSELLAEARLALLRRAGTRAAERLVLGPEGLQEVLDAIAGQPAPPEARDRAAFLESVLSSMVQRALLVGEARRLQLREVSEARVEEAHAELLALGADRALMRAALAEAGFGRGPGGGVSPALAAVLRAEIMAERLVDLRARSRAVVPEDVLRACYAKRAEALGDPGFEAVRDRLLDAIRVARVAERIAELIEQLEARIDVRYVAPFGPAPLPEVEDCPDVEQLAR